MAAEGLDTIESSVSYTLSSQVENLVLTGAAIEGIGAIQQLLFGGLQRLNPTDQPVDTSGGQADRIATADHTTAAWIDRGAYASPGVGAYGTLPRLDARSRHPFRRNVDLVITKALELKGTNRAEIRFEFLNLTNNPMFAGTGTDFGSQAFGRITTTRGYSRITQVSMRYTF